MTIAELQKKFQEQLALIYDTRESRAITQLALEHLLNLNRVKISLEKFRLLTTEEQKQAGEVLARLINQEPIQYITGKAYFYGLDFVVSPSVLIPRPETEELVQWIIEREKERGSFSILDIGTGSGCIAITLKKEIPQSNVHAMDISIDALQVAYTNAKKQNQPIHFIQCDVINDDWQETKYDVIVSNPPYIGADEKYLMRKNVLNHEPHLALFAEGDALIFYKTIALKALQSLTNEGVLYFEINENKAVEVAEILKHSGYADVEIKNDMSGKPRMAKAVKPN